MENTQINDIDTRELVISIDFYCVVKPEDYDLGAVKLKLGKKDLILDIISTEWYNQNKHTEILAKVVFDNEIDEEFKNDITFNELYSKDLSGTVYIGTEFEIEPESISMAIKHNGNTTMVNLDIE